MVQGVQSKELFRADKIDPVASWPLGLCLPQAGSRSPSQFYVKLPCPNDGMGLSFTKMTKESNNEENCFSSCCFSGTGNQRKEGGKRK